MKRDLKSANVNFEIVKYIVDDCSSYSILKLAVKNCILRKTILKFMNLIFGIFGKKLILKHFTHRSIPKRCVLGVFWTEQYVYEIYFTWRRLLLTLLTSFYGCNAFGWIYILLSPKNKRKFRSPTPVFWDYVLQKYFSWFLQKTRNVHFDLNFIFSISYKISFTDLSSLFMERITFFI